MADFHSRNSNLQPSNSRPKRPFAVTLLVIVVLSTTSLGWFGLGEILRHWDFIPTLPLSIPGWYFVLLSVLLGLVGLVLAYGLWFGRNWAWYAVQIVAVLFILSYWVDRLLFAQPVFIRERWPFVLGASVLFMSYVILVLRLPRSRRYFGK